MSKVDTIFCESKEDIEALKEDWAITWEGMSIDQGNLNALMNWVAAHTKVINRRVYVTTGKLMNTSYLLSGTNAYPDDVNIVSIKSTDIGSLNELSIPRFQVGGRWMYDIVENNVRREMEKKSAMN